MPIKLWRYTDFAKFVELISSARLWLSNAEILAADDPYEGHPSTISFPHRMYKSFSDLPPGLQSYVSDLRSSNPDETDEQKFVGWMMLEEQMCIMSMAGRRDFFVNCWHAADHESVAMWKVYGTLGGGVAIITNGARLEQALSGVDAKVYLGSIRYLEPGHIQFGGGNAFDAIMKKRSSFAYENEVRLVHWSTGTRHDPLANFEWNAEALRFDNLIEDTRPIVAGLNLEVDVETLVKSVLISPFAPPWYHDLIVRLRDRFGYKFEVYDSHLLKAPIAPE